MKELNLTLDEAKRFILYKQGLLGEHRFSGKEGVLDFVRQAGCIQFDPIDVCGKNAELVLQSRVSGFTKKMLYELLYEDRKLLDNWDKNLSIIPVENWPNFKRDRDWHFEHERSFDEIQKACEKIKAVITERGAVCSADLGMSEKVDWYWTSTKLSRAALEHMYFRGDLAIHHKKKSLKYYDLIERCLPQNVLEAADPYPDDFDHKKWRVLERIGSIGLLWNRPSDAWLGIGDLKSDMRNQIFDSLLADGEIVPVQVEGIKHKLYCLKDDEQIAEIVKGKGLVNGKSRCEFIAALDNMMWDRNLIKAIWNFDYKWEIYTPAAQRKYGYYVLPILYGENLIGRIEMVFDKKSKKLEVKNLWYEDGLKVTKKIESAVEASIKRFEKIQFILSEVIMKDLNKIKELCPSAYDFIVNKAEGAAVGKYNLENGAYVSVQEYTTKARSEAKYEAHKKFIDIQMILSGKELIAVSPIEKMTVSDEYNEEKDFMLFHHNDECTDYVLEAGDFLILYPQDVHMPGVCVNEKTPVRKIVVKVPVEK